METTDIDPQTNVEHSLFMPGMTVQAMRDSRYRHPANAVAELIDNSIDADSSRVELLIYEKQERVKQRRVWRVSKLAVIDNGHGMSEMELVQALRFGGRVESRRIQRIGKYGMGLPTASVSQCRRLDVWTWQNSIDRPSHSYIDVNQIQAEKQHEIPVPDHKPIPKEWHDIIAEETLNPVQGTLVVWSDIDRITNQADTIFNRVEKEIGRIYRHFIYDNEVTIRMAAFREGQLAPIPDRDRTVRPNDPLFLMHNSSTSKPWDNEPMFNDEHRHEFPVEVNGRQESIEVIYSLVRQEALGNQRANPGSLPHGQDARDNMGVSVVRENREILLDNSFVREGGRGNVPMNRWWGCEVRFSEGCDDLFGVDHNKQMAVAFSNAARELLNSERGTTQVLQNLGAENDPIYEIAAHIRDTTRSKLREIDIMFDRRREEKTETEKPLSPEDEANRLATVSVKDKLVAQRENLTQTDRDREEKDNQNKEKEIRQFLENEGYDANEAAYKASELVRKDFHFSFVPHELDGYQMFTVRSQGGILFIKLNIHHPLYDFLNLLEDRAIRDENPAVRRAAVGIRTLLLAWGRMEDHIENNEERRTIQQIALRWGEQVNEVLSLLNQQT